MPTSSEPLRFQGRLSSWNADRGFGFIAPLQGGEPIWVHVSAWPRDGGRPQVDQAVSFEVETGPKGKRARAVRLEARRTEAAAPPRRGGARPARPQARERAGERERGHERGREGASPVVVLGAFLLLCVVLHVVWQAPFWWAGVYGVASVVTLLVYTRDKLAAEDRGWRTPERTLHLLSLIGGWPGALVAQRVLRHKTVKRSFQEVFWATVALNVAALVAISSPQGRAWLAPWLGPLS